MSAARKNMDSDDYSTDEGSKKRNREEEESPFYKSKKTQRSPAKATNISEDKLDKVLNMMSNLSTQVQSLTAEVQKMGKDQNKLAEEIKSLRLENETLIKENKEIKKEYMQMKEELRSMSWRINKLEEAKRENNIVVTGMEIITEENAVLKETVETLVRDVMGLEIKAKAAHKLGPKICLVELNTKEDKLKVMKNKQKLKGLKDKKIFINNDLTPEERDIDRSIRKIAHEERSKGKNVWYGYHKITVDGKKYIWNRDKSALEEVQSTKDMPKN